MVRVRAWGMIDSVIVPPYRPGVIWRTPAGAVCRLFLAVGLLAVAACSARDEDGVTEADEAPADGQPAQAIAPAAPPAPPPALRALREPWVGDFDGMRQRRVIRVAMPHAVPLFFYSDGSPRGILYEFVQQFERELNERLNTGNLKIYVVPVPVSRQRMIPDLLDGHVDMIAADLTVTTGRRALVDFSMPLLRDVREVVVAGPAAPPLDSLRDLAGQTVFVRVSSSYFEHLSGLSAFFAANGLEEIDIQPADEMLEAGDLIEMVSASLLPMTVVDNYRARLWAGVFPDIEVREDLAVNEGGRIAWAWRQDSPLLAEQVNRFIRSHRPGTLFGNVVMDKYLDNPRWIGAATTSRDLDKLRGLADVFRTFADEYGHDWLKLAAQAYQESGLRQERVSPAGAVGIMQVKPSTASDRNVAIDNIDTIEGNVEAGAKYMRFLEDRYFSSETIGELDSWLFALAAYNAGPAKVARLRTTARREGFDADVWFQNVEVIAAREIGRETVQYVSNVFKYFVAYRLVWDQTRQRARVQQTAADLVHP